MKAGDKAGTAAKLQCLRVLARCASTSQQPAARCASQPSRSDRRILQSAVATFSLFDHVSAVPTWSRSSPPSGHFTSRRCANCQATNCCHTNNSDATQCLPHSSRCPSFNRSARHDGRGASIANLVACGWTTDQRRGCRLSLRLTAQCCATSRTLPAGRWLGALVLPVQSSICSFCCGARSSVTSAANNVSTSETVGSWVSWGSEKAAAAASTAIDVANATKEVANAVAPCVTMKCT